MVSGCVGKYLPASRALATSLGVSRDTIESAYGQLHAEGFIERRVGSGSFVSERTRRLPGRNLAEHRQMQIVRCRTSASLVAPCFRAVACMISFLISRPFAPGVSEMRSFPLAIWERLERQGTERIRYSCSAAQPTAGRGCGATVPCHYQSR
ncbi:MAG: GntR family transcriptional regulator [Candidatus Malihini olakiniferum]